MPEDSIMDIVDNTESLYAMLERLYQHWYRLGTKPREMHEEALSLATVFARTIGQGHGQGAVRKAATEIFQGFKEHKRYHEAKLQSKAQAEAHEAKLVQFWEKSLSPEAAAHAKHYEALVRQSSIPILRDVLRDFVPASAAQMKQALEQGDFNLDSIPMETWLAAAEQVPYMSVGDLPPEEKVFLLKHVAKYHYGI